MPQTVEKPARKKKPPQITQPNRNSASKPNSTTNHRNDSAPAQNGARPDHAPVSPAADTWQIIWIPVEKIAPNPLQPRLTFDPAEMGELVASVKQRGVQQPITVRTAKPVESPTPESPDSDPPAGAVSNVLSAPPLPYELVAGERRLRGQRSQMQPDPGDSAR